EKSKIVYCRDSNRSERHLHASFTFLGFTFRPRKARSPQGGPSLCAEHVQQLGGESPLSNLMVVKD
ncbi:hypothetical protein PO002_46175, partial [Cupriavidus necator]